ncbi:MAG: septum formation initiator family protein [Selenomonadaceae bacterium]|nr:septum formation initiator family protein [Selenomonadaceae bacterium]
MGTKIAKKKRGINWYYVLIAVIILYFSSVLIHQQFYLNQVGADKQTAESRVDQARAENEALKAERDRLNDRAFIEKVAREELGLTKPGELPYSSAGKR